MLATVSSATLLGTEGYPVVVEVHVANGFPGFRVVGLPDTSCREARDRVRAAIVSSGFNWPQKRVTVNLAPSGMRKGGSGLDLPIALGVLAADRQIQADYLGGTAFLGELGLDGTVRKIPGVLPLVDAVRDPAVVVPLECSREASLVRRGGLYGAVSLGSLIAILQGRACWPEVAVALPRGEWGPTLDLADVRGQPLARRALEVASAGAHHLLLVGPAGAGKTMLANRLPGLLPDLSTAEALEVAKIHSAAGLELPGDGLCLRPPFRCPHHGASAVALIGGGGARLRPGEVSCAHNGVLFLDELAEFPGPVLDSLRQPVEEGRVVICRASAAVAFPARFLLVAAMNACRCGADGSPGSCRCSDATRERYHARVSGPLLDRFDLRVRVQQPEVGALLAPRSVAGEAGAEEPTSVVAVRVAKARRRARERGLRANSELPPWRLDELAPIGGPARRLLERRLREGLLSARGLHRVRRVALTVADLAGEEGPLSEEHILMALALRGQGIVGDGGGFGAGSDGAMGAASPAAPTSVHSAGLP
jgi:magnesium chelatase family protein